MSCWRDCRLCAAACYATAKYISLNSPQQAEMCKLMAEACNRGAEICEEVSLFCVEAWEDAELMGVRLQHGKHGSEHCKDCAEACRKCIKLCA
jgi:hypothetical protein